MSTTTTTTTTAAARRHLVADVEKLMERVAYLEEENEFLKQQRSFSSSSSSSHNIAQFHQKHRSDGRKIWVSCDHDSLQVSRDLLGAALPGALKGFPVAIFAKYEANVNTAVKGAAIAAARLEKKGRYVGLQAQFRENRNELTLLVVDIRPRYDKYTSNILTVASHTDYKVLGGAIASRVRDSVDTMQRGGGGPPILLRAIGKRAVWAATRAIAVTREYLEESGPNIIFLPHFNVVQLPNRLEPSTVLEFYIFPSSDSSSSS